MTLEGAAFGTGWRARIVAAATGLTESAVKADIASELARLDAIFSTWREDSVVGRFNAHASCEPFPVPAELAEVVEAALRVSDESAGAFDITVLPVVERFGFGPSGSVALSSNDALVDYRLLRVARDHSGPSLVKADPDVRIDLSAIAKGYAIDRVRTRLRSMGLGNHLVEIGGEIGASGASIDGQGWLVGIESPSLREGSPRLAAAVRLVDFAIATSGMSRQGFTLGGRRFGHLVDPRNRTAEAQPGMGAVTIGHESAMWADAYATTVFVLGVDEGARFCQDHGLAVLILSPDGTNAHDSLGADPIH